MRAFVSLALVLAAGLSSYVIARSLDSEAPTASSARETPATSPRTIALDIPAIATRVRAVRAPRPAARTISAAPESNSTEGELVTRRQTASPRPDTAEPEVTVVEDGG